MSLFRNGIIASAALAACCLAFAPGRAVAADFDPHGLYVAFHTGYAAPSDGHTALPGLPGAGELDFDKDVTFSAAAGLSLDTHIRMEGEVNYRSPDADSATLGGVPVAAGGDITTWALMLNTYYDFRPNKRVSPYVSAGIGAAHHSADLNIGGTTAGDSDVTFAWAAGAGVSYALSDQLSLSGGYRYIDTGNPDFGPIRTETKAHEFRLGLTIKLNPPARPYTGR